jgi:hypothetical protein
MISERRRTGIYNDIFYDYRATRYTLFNAYIALTVCLSVRVYALETKDCGFQAQPGCTLLEIDAFQSCCFHALICIDSEFTEEKRPSISSPPKC